MLECEKTSFCFVFIFFSTQNLELKIVNGRKDKKRTKVCYSRKTNKYTMGGMRKRAFMCLCVHSLCSLPSTPREQAGIT
jgi:hypothetical protein